MSIPTERLNTVGKSVARLDGIEKVTGKAVFTQDIAPPGMLYAKVLRSPHAHARIVGIDISKALKLPGVRAVVTPEDMPAVSISPALADQYIFCHGGIARCAGEPVAAVAADSADIAKKAVGLIEVDYQELPAIFDGEEAFRTDATVVVHPDLAGYKVMGRTPFRRNAQRPNVCHACTVRRGDLAEGFQKADLIIENRFATARIQHCPMEPHMAIARFEPDGSLTVNSTTQKVYEVKETLARVFSLSPSRVRIICHYIGGGFGSKGGIAAEPIAALLGRKTGRPVGLFFSREEMTASGGHRVPFTIYVKDGVKKDGSLVARRINAILAIGAFSYKGVSIARVATSAATGIYRTPHFECNTYAVYTNLPLTAALRGFGCPEIEWAVEQHMDIIAASLGMDSVELRRKNILNEGERNAHGMVTRSIGVRECLDKVARWISWEKEPKLDVGPWKRGKGIAIGSKPTNAGSVSVVSVKVWPDATVEVRHGGSEVGQGLKTTLAQIVAEEFGLPVEQIKMGILDTDYCGYDFGTVSSRSVTHLGNALIAACKDAKGQLFKMAAAKLGAWDLATQDGKIYAREEPGKSIKIGDLFSPLGIPLEGIEIVGKGEYKSPSAPEDSETGQSERPVFAHSYIATAVEVAVNVETGEIKVLKSGVACDVGKAINPQIVEGQIQGGDAMGIGSAIYEEVVLDSHGAVMNSCLRDYHIPTAMDLPATGDTNAMIVEEPEADGPYGSKGVGELTMVAAAPAIANAVFNAVGARVMDLPLSRERVWQAIRKANDL